MTIEELREKLGISSIDDIEDKKYLFEEAKKNNLVVCFYSSSGDSLEFRGAIEREKYFIENKITSHGLVYCDCDGAESYGGECIYYNYYWNSIPHYVSSKKILLDDGSDHHYHEVKTNIKNAVSFDILKDYELGEFYCKGIIFSLDDVKAGEKMKEVESI